MLRHDPLLHFLAIGGILFVLLSWFDAGPQPERILITADRVAELSRTAELLQGRTPTQAELERLVTDAIREEVYYREALALGLDVDDTVVRQRLIEKMRELTENVVDPVPADADLEAWFEANRALFRIPELVSFDHIFFSPTQRGAGVVAEAEAALEALRGGSAPDGFGDSTPLSGRFESADAPRVRTLFDDPLTDAVFAADPGLWIGPFESGFGWHVVRVTDHSAARDPEFAEVEDRVRSVYASEQLAAANAEAFDRMREEFSIAVQWQGDGDPESWP
jgi:peptidyl-prolyl cis-trans isomerase C